MVIGFRGEVEAQVDMKSEKSEVVEVDLNASGGYVLIVLKERNFVTRPLPARLG